MKYSKEEFVFEKSNNKTKYSLKHSVIPIVLDDNMSEIIKYLLWYVPNISSYQSYHNELISSIDFEDFSFDIIKESMHLKNSDIMFTEDIDEDVVNFYLDRIDTSSQKIILTKAKSETYTESLLRHIRNSIAHGFFNTVGGMLIGFDFKTEELKPSNATAIFKIFPEYLLNGLKALSSELTSKKLALRVLEKNGYTIEKFSNDKTPSNNHFDFYVKKDKKRYALSILKYTDIDYLPKDEVENLINTFSDIKDGIIPVLFINTSLLTDELKDYLLSKKVIILDTKNIKYMLNSRDMLAEIHKFSRVHH